jgi:hypothetical protein
MRQKPRQHTVSQHTREGAVVHSYKRGVIKPSIQKKRTYVPIYLEEPEYLPNTSIKIKWERLGNPAGTTRVWMTPEEYLSYTPPPSGGKFSPDSLKWLRESYTLKGGEFVTPYLDVRFKDNQVTGHEGRHRAYWAMLQNITKIPVLIVWEDKNYRQLRVKKEKFGKLKPQGLLEIKKDPYYGTHSFYSALDVAEGTPLHEFPTKELFKPKPKKQPKIHKTYKHMGLEDKARIMASTQKKTGKMCWDCGRDNMVYDSDTKKWVCLSCGAIQ